MTQIKLYNNTDFSAKEILSLKRQKKIYVIFTTLGDKEAEYIAEKINLFKSENNFIIDKIFLAHRRMGSEPDQTEFVIKNYSDVVELVICNNLHVPDMGTESGRGADLRRALYHINTKYVKDNNPDDFVIIYMAEDIISEFFDSDCILALAGAILSGSDFAKASFWRSMGRVKKYVAQPLLSLFNHPDLAHLTEIAYPVSNEVAGTLKFFNSVQLWQNYGLETGILLDAILSKCSVADVNLGFFEHEHRSETTIQKMSFGIMRTFMIKMKEYGFLKLENNLELSDRLEASYIDENGDRKKFSHMLAEIEYQPLNKI